MYKVKISLWFLVLCCIFLITDFKNTLKNVETVDISIETKTNNLLPQQFSELSSVMYKYNVKQRTGDNVDLIIKETSDEEIKGYIKDSETFESPIVMFVNKEANNENSGFTQTKKGSLTSSLTKDLKVILKAMLEDKTWEQIGVSKKVAVGKVNLLIPNRDSEYYHKIKEVIYLTLNDGKVLKEKDIERLKSDVDVILKKCTETEDLSQTIYSVNEARKGNYPVALAPEFLIASISSTFDTTNAVYFQPVYLKDTVSFKYDTFLNEKISISRQKNIISIFNEKDKVLYETGLRVRDRNYKLDSASGFHRAKEMISIVNNKEEIVKIIKNK